MKQMMIRNISMALCLTACINTVLAQTEESRTRSVAKQLRYAIITSPDISIGGIGDLLTLRLLSEPSITLVERDAVHLALRELEMASLWDDQSIVNRLALGRMLNADRLVIINDADNHSKELRLIIIDTLCGAILLKEEFSVHDNLENVCDQIASFVKNTHFRYINGVHTVLAIPDFVSNSFLQDFDYLQKNYPEILGTILSRHQGVAVISLEESQAIQREFDLTGGEIQRMVPIQIRGEYHVHGKNKYSPQNIDMKLEISDGSKVLKSIEKYSLTEIEAIQFLVTTVPQSIFSLLKQENTIVPLSREQQKNALIQRADEFHILGAYPHEIRHLEAALLLDPNDVDLSLRLLLKTPLPGMKQFELFRSVFRRKMVTFTLARRLFEGGYFSFNSHLDVNGKVLNGEDIARIYSPIHHTHPLEEDYNYIQMAPLIYQLPHVEDSLELQPGIHFPGNFNDFKTLRLAPTPMQLKVEEWYFHTFLIEKVMRFTNYLDGMRREKQIDQDFADTQIRESFQILLELQKEMPDDVMPPVSCYSNTFIPSQANHPIVYQMPEFLDYIRGLRYSKKNNLILLADCLDFSLKINGDKAPDYFYDEFLSLEQRVIVASTEEWKKIDVSLAYLQDISFIEYKLSLLIDVAELNQRIMNHWSSKETPAHIQSRLNLGKESSEINDASNIKERVDQYDSLSSATIAAMQLNKESVVTIKNDLVFSLVDTALLPDGLYPPKGERQTAYHGLPKVEGITRLNSDSDLIWNIQKVFLIKKAGEGVKPTIREYFDLEQFVEDEIINRHAIYQVMCDAEYVWIVSTKGIILLDTSGGILARFDEQAGLPPFVLKGLRSNSMPSNINERRRWYGIKNIRNLYPERFRGTRWDPTPVGDYCLLGLNIGNGVCIAVGCFGEQGRTWIAKLTYDSSQKSHKVKILHTAVQIGSKANTDFKRFPYIFDKDHVFECRWATRFDDPLFPERHQILIGREYDAEYVDIPILVDINTDEVCLLTDRYPDLHDVLGGIDVKCEKGHIVLVERTNLKIFYRNDSGTFESVNYEWAGFYANDIPSQSYRLFQEGNIIHYPGKNWYRINLNENVPGIEILHATNQLIPVTSCVDFADSSVYGSIAISGHDRRSCDERNCRCGNCRRIMRFQFNTD